MKKLSLLILMFIVSLISLWGPSSAQGKKVDLQLQRLLMKEVNHTNYKSFENKLVNLKVDKKNQVLISVFIKADPKALDKLVKVGAKINTVLSSGTITADIPVKSLRSLIALPEVEEIEAGRKMELYTDQSIPSASGVGLNLTRESNLTGQGIIVGAVDTGIDYTHEDFIKSDGTTRILYIWDQSDYSDTNPPPGYTIGCEYTSAYINAALSGAGGTGLGQKDTNGHGTHVMGTIAGHDSIYKGVAPEADIIMVKYDFDGDRNDSTYMVEAIEYIFSKAADLGRPAVVNLSMGNDYGPHDGTTLEERSINDLVGPGKIVVVAAGNAGRNLGSPNRALWGDPIHGNGTIQEGSSSSINLTVPSYIPDSTEEDNDYIFFDIWYEGDDLCQVQITTPSGMKYPPNFLGRNRSVWKTGSQGGYYTTPEGTILVFNASPGDLLGWGSNNGDKELYIEISEYAGSHVPAQGVWKIEIFDRGGLTSGPYHGWHGTSDSLTTASFSYEGGNPDNVMTIGNPASAAGVIAIGAYATKLCWDYLGGTQQQCYGVYPLDYYDPFTVGDIAYFSSQGPTRDGRTKPDISAPGVGICASLSSMLDAEQYDYYYNHNRVVPDGTHGILQGTSMACPHGTGSVALLLAKMPNLDPTGARSILTDTATEDGFTGDVPEVPNNIWGHGKINLDAALAYQPPNQPPVAEAGSDLRVVDEDGDGSVSVTLDGTGSYDPDGTITSYEWAEGGVSLGTGAVITSSFSPGIHTVTLTVTDDAGVCDTDEVIITVQSPAPPPSLCIKEPKLCNCDGICGKNESPDCGDCQ